MASQRPNRMPMYPEVIQSNPDNLSSVCSDPNKSSSSQSSLYPQIDTKDLDNLFPDSDQAAHNPTTNVPSAPPESVEEIVLTVPGAILHLIDKHYSVELACGDLSILRLRQGDSVVAVLICVADEIQWPLTKDEATVKLDESHYFFSLHAPKESVSDSSDDESGDKGSVSDLDNLLNYGLTIASKGQEGLLKKLDEVLEYYSSFSVQKVSENGTKSDLLDGTVTKEISPADLKSEKKVLIEERCAAYWTTLAPNVEDYSGTAAKLIAAGSGQLIKGILWCGDVTIDRLKWGNEVWKKRIKPSSSSEISPQTLKKIKRVKRVTKMTEKVATGVLTGVVKVSGFFTSSVANSKVGKKFFSLLPGEIVLASLDGFSKVCDAVEVAGKEVMSTSATVTTGLVSHKYGEEAAKATSEGLDAAGHAVGTAWTVFKIRKAINPKSVITPSTLAKSAAKAAASEMKAKKKSEAKKKK
ncbi:Protein EARLY-RESPONSIVE TO DEHYDRATION 7, chloroplastic [Sarracenia purpurea var. burkii]